MFQFTRLPFITYLFSYEYQTSCLMSFLIRIRAGQRLLTALHTFSQPPASFIGCYRLGILRVPLVVYLPLVYIIYAVVKVL